MCIKADWKSFCNDSVERMLESKTNVSHSTVSNDSKMFVIFVRSSRVDDARNNVCICLKSFVK